MTADARYVSSYYATKSAANQTMLAIVEKVVKKYC